jgi:glucose-6-phosphate dehydrogenase assembly protein OpcA
MAPALTSVREIQRELRRLVDETIQGERGPALRTSVMTHLAWVPPEWREAAEAVLAGLGGAHPSRTIVLLPDPDAPDDGLDAEVELGAFAQSGGRQVFSEVLRIRLRGSLAGVPASVVVPLLRSDLPVFLRWRGPLPLGAPELEQLVDVADRLVVDGREWPGPEGGYARLPALFRRAAVSDIAWARLLPWREALAGLWPAVAAAVRVRVVGPRAEAILLAGWLGARLGRTVGLEHEPAPEIELVSVDGSEARPDRPEARSPSDLLSDQLEIFAHDPIYEEAVCSFSSRTG